MASDFKGIKATASCGSVIGFSTTDVDFTRVGEHFIDVCFKGAILGFKGRGDGNMGVFTEDTVHFAEAVTLLEVTDACDLSTQISDKVTAGWLTFSREVLEGGLGTG